MKTFLLRATIAFIPLLISLICKAQPGTLDSSFGVNGRSTVYVPGINGTETSVLQKDGKILVAGGSYSVATTADFAVSRYFSNGSLDSTFGNKGKNIVDFFSYIDDCHAIALQTDGKIILAGAVYREYYTPFYKSIGFFGLVRFTTDGKIDSTFGINGKVISNFDSAYNDFFCYSLTVQKDGKIIAAGYGGVGFNDKGFSSIRYNSNGSVDITYGLNGLQMLPGRGFVHAITIDSAENILLAGSTNNDPQNTSVKLVRLKKNGVIDSSFGINGITLTDISNQEDIAYSICLQPDGKILLAGKSRYDLNNSYFFVSRYLYNGKIDSSFANNGVALANFGQISCAANSVIIQTDGKILVGGYNKTILMWDSYRTDFALIRYKITGAIDSSFGSNGKVLTSFVSSSSEGKTLLLQPDNKILFIGYTYINNYLVTLLRYKNDEPLSVSIKKNISITEGNSGTTPARFNIGLNKPSTTSVTFNYTTKNLSAKAGSDFTAKSGKLTFGAGVVNKSLTIDVTGDNLVEPNERFALVLSNPVNAELGTIDSAICIIKNDDPSFSLSHRLQEDIGLSNKSIKIYPNPVKDVLNIQGLSIQDKVQFSITDVNGKVLATKSVNTSSFTWNIKTLPAGSYFLQIQSIDNTETLSFIKQ